MKNKRVADNSTPPGSADKASPLQEKWQKISSETGIEFMRVERYFTGAGEPARLSPYEQALLTDACDNYRSMKP